MDRLAQRLLGTLNGPSSAVEMMFPWVTCLLAKFAVVSVLIRNFKIYKIEPRHLPDLYCPPVRVWNCGRWYGQVQTLSRTKSRHRIKILGAANPAQEVLPEGSCPVFCASPAPALHVTYPRRHLPVVPHGLAVTATTRERAVTLRGKTRSAFLCIHGPCLET